jgi:hypothetical protein
VSPTGLPAGAQPLTDRMDTTVVHLAPKSTKQFSASWCSKTNLSDCIAADAGPFPREVSPRIVSRPLQQIDIDHLPACRIQLAVGRFHKTQ